MNGVPKREPTGLPVGEIVSIYLRGRTWYCNYQYQGKQVRLSLKTRSKKEATLRAQRIETDLDRGASPAKIAPSKIADVVKVYLMSVEVEGRAPSTLQKYRYVTDCILQLAAETGRSNIAQLDADFADAYRSKLKAKGRKPKTIYGALVILRTLILFAIRRRMCVIDPLSGYKLRKPKPTPQPCWSPVEADKIIELADPAYRDFFVFLRETGCRCGEAKHLTWGDVDLQHRVLHIRPKDDWKPKTGDQRKIPITDRLRDMLRSRQRVGRWVFTSVVKSATGKEIAQIRRAQALVVLKKILVAIGLKGHLHTFRHTYISQALSRGVPEAVVRSWVGHVDGDMIRLYTHISDDVSRAYVSRFSFESPDLTTAPRSNA